MKLTARYLKSVIYEQTVSGRGPGAHDLTVLHDDLGVQGQPVAAGLLDIEGVKYKMEEKSFFLFFSFMPLGGGRDRSD